MSTHSVHTSELEPLSRTGRVFVALTLLVAVFLAFAPCLSAEFVSWDDDANFTQNRAYRGLGLDNLACGMGGLGCLACGAGSCDKCVNTHRLEAIALNESAQINGATIRFFTALIFDDRPHLLNNFVRRAIPRGV